MIWQTILELGRQRKKHIVFVCNEEKPDWIVRSNNTIIGTREELRQEFVRETSQFFALTSYSTFLRLLGAGRDTVTQARNIEQLDSLDFILVQQRVSRILQTIQEIVSEFSTNGDNSGSGYEFIRDSRFDAMVTSFYRTREQYDVLIHSEAGAKFLEQLEVTLRKIQSSNGCLQYLEARMKQDGEHEMQELRDHCVEFAAAYQQWSQWYLAGSP